LLEITFFISSMYTTDLVTLEYDDNGQTFVIYHYSQKIRRIERESDTEYIQECLSIGSHEVR
jgi:hypothetical protein